ncbi:MAG TPA: hypothetical protein VN328_05195 [Thermodesulfovibrionales bacterium]|nr:hypothetical protein [Thermodesulfovibrionales bacterium]
MSSTIDSFRNRIVLSHIGVINQSEEQAVRFYASFLGLEKTREFFVPAELSAQIFSVSRDMKVLVFEKQEIKVEVFIFPNAPDAKHR